MSQSTAKSHTGETKGQRFARSFLAFALFIVFSLLSLLICFRASFVNTDRIVKVFSNDAYVSALRQDILSYSREMLKRNMLPEDTLDEAVGYSAVRSISYAYASGMTGASEEYSETAYLDYIDDLAAQMADAVNSRIKADGLTVDKQQKKEGTQIFVDGIRKHVKSCVEKPFMEKAVQVLKLSRIGSLAGVIALAVVAVLLLLIVPSIGEKRYRALRYVVHALNAAALLNLLLAAGAAVVAHTKDLYIFPTYFKVSVMHYVNSGILTIALSAFVLFFAAMALTAVVWKMKREKKK